MSAASRTAKNMVIYRAIRPGVAIWQTSLSTTFDARNRVGDALEICAVQMDTAKYRWSAARSVGQCALIEVSYVRE
jgi:hypothetical protein